MPRRVQDIIPGDRRSIKDVQPKIGRSKDETVPDGRKVSLRRLPLTPPLPKRKSSSRRRGRFAFVALLVVVAAVIAGYAASTRFSHAAFTLAARTVPVSISAAVVFSGTSTPGYVSYQTIKLSAAASTTVAAADGPVISTKAHGSVTIYNAYSAQSQRLVAGTRLANDSGLIYRLTGSVSVPGYALLNGSVKPGSVAAAIVADQPGEEYDLTKASAPADFKVIAYQGSPKYDGFYARLAADIAGGENGQKKTVSPSILASTTAILDAQLTARLLALAKAAVPADSIMYDGAYVVDLAPPSVGGGSPHSAVVSVQGAMYAVLFKKADLIARLAGPTAIAGFGDFAYGALGLESLSFTVSNAKDFSPQKKSVLIARFSGPMKLVGVVPAEEIKQKLAGLPLSDTEKVLQTYDQVIDIKKSIGELSPSWVTRVPTDLKRISVQVLSGS